MAKKKHKPGPKADTLKIEGDWTDAVAKAVNLERPPEGWPDNTPDNPVEEEPPEGESEEG